MPRKPRETDEDAAQELYLFIRNDGKLYESATVPIQKNLMRKRAQGRYDHARAVDAFVYLAEDGAKKYVRELGGGAYTFGPAERRAAAAKLANYFLAEAEAGNLDYLLPEAARRPVPRKTSAQLDREVEASLKKSGKR